MTSMSSRRTFLADVGRGMLIASVGSSVATDLGFGAVSGVEIDERLTFGHIEPLVAFMQETSADRLLPQLVEKWRAGTDLSEFVAAAALANARTFGGEDYVGFHTMMALSPALQMARELPPDHQPLPVLKVLYRNTNRIQESGGTAQEKLRAVQAGELESNPAEALRATVRARDVAQAERLFAAMTEQSVETAWNDLLLTVQDNTEVHRTVLPYRAWDLLDVVGKQHAQTLLRQSIRYCIRAEGFSRPDSWDEPRTLLPRLLDEYKLLGREPGRREADDAWIDQMSNTIFRSTTKQAAEAAAAALAEGFSPDAIAEALSLAANQLVLRDEGRPAIQEQPGKPIGSVHGDSIGVHACDSANAWRNMARVSNTRNTFACVILGAYQVALDRVHRGGDFLNWQPHPLPALVQRTKSTEPEALLQQLDAAIRDNLQAHAAAITHRYGELGHPARPIFDRLLRYAISEDGALHAEKYYRTVCEEFAATRPAFRWRQLTALARVTASEFGRRAPGYDEAKSLLKV